VFYLGSRLLVTCKIQTAIRSERHSVIPGEKEWTVTSNPSQRPMHTHWLRTVRPPPPSPSSSPSLPHRPDSRWFQTVLIPGMAELTPSESAYRPGTRRESGNWPAPNQEPMANRTGKKTKQLPVVAFPDWDAPGRYWLLALDLLCCEKRTHDSWHSKQT
jgi:hypothetical protein